MTALRQRMLEDMKIRNLALNTQECYLLQVSQFARHFGKSPELLGREDIVLTSSISPRRRSYLPSPLRSLYLPCVSCTKSRSVESGNLRTSFLLPRHRRRSL